MSLGWSEPKGELARGPFETMEEIIEDVRDYLNPSEDIQIEVGTCMYAMAENFINDDVNDFLEKMDEQAADNEFGFYDDEIFTLKGEVTMKEVQEALSEALTAWAKKYVTSSVWCLEKTEVITVKGREHTTATAQEVVKLSGIDRGVDPVKLADQGTVLTKELLQELVEKAK